MVGRGVKCNKQHCDYGCGSRHACTHAIIFHLCACHPHLSLSAHTVIRLCSCPLSLICALMYPCQSKSVCMLIVHVPAHLSTLGCTGWPSLAPPALIHTHCCFFVLISILLLVPVCPTWLHWLVLMLITACSCPLLYAHLHLFAGPCLSLPICVHLVVLVPAWLYLSLLPGCTCLAFAYAHWCSFGFVCAGSALFVLI